MHLTKHPGRLHGHLPPHLTLVWLLLCTNDCRLCRRMGGNARVLPKGGAVPPKGSTAHLMPHSDSNSSMSDANPSVRFGNAVATSEEFGGKFGHYGRQVPSPGQQEPGGHHLALWFLL